MLLRIRSVNKSNTDKLTAPLNASVTVGNLLLCSCCYIVSYVHLQWLTLGLMVKAVAMCILAPTAREVKTDFKTVHLAHFLPPVLTPMMLDYTAQHVRKIDVTSYLNELHHETKNISSLIILCPFCVWGTFLKLCIYNYCHACSINDFSLLSWHFRHCRCVWCTHLSWECWVWLTQLLCLPHRILWEWTHMYQ